MCLTPPVITTMGMGRTAGMKQKALFIQTQKIGLSIRMCTLHVIYYILYMYTNSSLTNASLLYTYIYVRCGRVQDMAYI